MAAGGFDGSIRIDTRVDSSGFNKGVKSIDSGINGIMGSLKRLAAAVGLAFGVAAVVNFGKASVKASTDLTNAMTGLKSIVEGQGRSFSDAQKFINSYISDGLVPATNAVTAYKNLASRGYTDPQIQQVLTALKDSAAFGRQASYSLGDAVSTATEGLKNENSILVDNAGVTKNVAKMWEDYGKSIGVSANNLTKQQKIQAEVSGIMEETRFQTGDAAKVASTYSGEVLKLGFNFNNLKIAIGNALIPMAQAVLPGLNAIITALTRVANLFAQVTTALFGKQAAQQQAVANTANNIASSSNSAAKAQGKLADATKKAGKAADNNMASWDDLNVLQEDTPSAGAADATDTGVAAAIPTVAGGELGAGVTVSPDVQNAADAIMGIFDNLNKAFEPTKAALQGLWPEFERLGSFSWSALQDFYDSFLVPVGKWTLGVGLPGFISAMKDGMSKIDWGKINTSLHGLWVALTPFAINVGEGLLWFWKNVLIPLGTWTMNNVVPLFLDILANGIKVLNGIIEALKPLGLWLFDNFLKPLAEWTGGVIVSVLTDVKDALGGLSDWVSQNGESVRSMVVNIGAAFVTWKTVEFLADIQRLVGADGLGSLGTALKIIAEDRFPKLAESLTGGVKGLKDFATNTMDTVTQAGHFISTLSSSVYSTFQLAMVKMTEGIKAFAASTLDAIKAAGEFLVKIGQQVVGLITSAAQWVAHTAVVIAHTVAQWAENAATTAWTAICTAATAVTTAFGAAMAFLTSPIGLVILAIAAVIAIVVLLITHWDQVKAVAIACWNGIVAAWKAAAAWFNTTVVQPVGKFFTDLWNTVSGAAGKAWDGIKGIWEIVSGWFHDKVIAPLETAFKTSINFMIGLVEGFVNSFVDGINVVIGLLNNFHVDIPDWDIFGDMRGQTFGINIPRVSRLSIPRLATGAVIPPNSEFLAILGDNKNGQNLEAPEGLIRQIMRDELSNLNLSPSFTLEATGDMGAVMQLINIGIKKENNRVGAQLVTGGGRY